MANPPALAAVLVDRVASDVVVLHVSGELDTTSTSSLSDPITTHVVSPNRAVVVNLSEVRFLGSAGLEALVLGQQRAAKAGVQFLLVADNRSALRPIEATGLDTVFTILPSVEVAVEHFAG